MRYLMGRYGVSMWRACRVAKATRSSMYYASWKDPLPLRQRVRELAQTRVRFGYRRLRVLLFREGWKVGRERASIRVYTEEELALQRKRPWRHTSAVHREQRRPTSDRNDIWSMDFVSDELADGRSTVLGTDGDRSVHARMPGDRRRRSLSGEDVAARLDCLRFARGSPLRQRHLIISVAMALGVTPMA
jgi:putative transposase